MSSIKIESGNTLLEVGNTLAALFDLRPEKAEQFLGDWLEQCVQGGAYPSFTVDQVGQGALFDQVGRFMSRFVEYLTPEQQARFVLDNLPSVVARENFQRCVAALIELCEDPAAAEVLRNAGDAAHALTDWSLQAVLGELAGPGIQAEAIR